MSGAFTNEQQGPLLMRTSSVALAAGAGCGKTTVLTGRFLNEIDLADGRALRSLAVMTFTDKAARELRQRIRESCRAKLATGGDRAWWTTVLRALEAAPIGTFHDFCGRVLRTRAASIGVDPEFVVLDDVVAGALREQAVGSAVRQLLVDRDLDLLSLAIPHTLRSLREMLVSVLASRAPEDVDPLCDLEASEIVARWREAWTSTGRPAILERLAPLLRTCRRVMTPLVDVGPKLTQLRVDVLDALSAVESPSCRDADLDRLHTVARVTGLRGKNDWPDDDVKEVVKAVFEELRTKIADVRKRLVWDDAVTLAAAEETTRFARIAREARAEYDALKKRRRGLDFADLIILTRDALRDPPLADAEEPEVNPSAIELVLVDEFQDTDQTQSEILKLLAGAGFLDGRMFVVGDAKQSIYRFRGAEPAVFGRWREEFPEPGRMRLSRNFRTVPRILDFVNALFADSFAEPGGLADPAAVHLAPIRPDHAESPAVHFFWVEPPSPSVDDPEPAKPSVKELRIQEAEALAAWLRAKIDAGWTVVDRRTRQPRPAHAGDVAFLFRSMTDVWPYETALADQGFDYYTIGGSAFYSQQEILDVVNLLSVVEDPLDDVALAGCLRSPFFALSDEGLYWLSQDPGLARNLSRAETVAGLSDRDRLQAQRAQSLLARWRALKDHVPMARLLSRMLDESGFSEALVCEFLGARKLANVRKLVETAREFDRRGGFGLSDFVGRLRAFADDPPREEQATTTEEDSPSVRLMTIHQAKGLEFPIVVLPDLNRNPGAGTASMGFDRRLGLVLKPKLLPTELTDAPGSGESLGWLAYRAIEEREEREESLRLFYVAATRARDELILSSGFDTPLEQVAASVAKLSPALNLLWERFDGRTGRCTASLPDGWPQPEIAMVDVAAIAPAEKPREGRRPRPKLPEIAAAILDAPREAPPPSSKPRRPSLRFIDLDARRAGTSRAARLGELIRAAAVDPGLLDGEPAEEVVHRLGLRRSPAAGGSLRAEAAAWLRAWIASPFFGKLREAASAGVRGGEGWVLQGSTTVRGSTDALVRGDDGRWRPLTFLTPGEPEAWGRLRASLAPPALEAQGFGPLGPSWLLSVADGSLHVERREPIQDDERDRLLQALTKG